MNAAYNYECDVFTHYLEAKDENTRLMNEVKKISYQVHAELRRTSHPRSHVVLYPTALVEDQE